MFKILKNKAFAFVLSVLVMALGVVVAPSFTNNAQAAAASEKTVYVDVEKNVIGQAPLIKPIKKLNLVVMNLIKQFYMLL